MSIISFRRSGVIHFTYLHTDVCLLNLAVPLHRSHRNNLATIFSTRPEQTSFLKATALIVLCLFGLRYAIPLNRTKVISYIISQTFQECYCSSFRINSLAEEAEEAACSGNMKQLHYTTRLSGKYGRPESPVTSCETYLALALIQRQGHKAKITHSTYSINSILRRGLQNEHVRLYQDSFIL